MFLLCSKSSPFTEGVFRRRSVGGAGRRRLQARLVTSSQEARSPSAPDEGAAFNGWTGLDEGQRKCCLDNVRIWSSGPGQEVRRPRQKSPPVERREARLPVTRHAAPLRGATVT